MTTETSIYEYAKQGLALSADKPAIWFYGKSITYRELFEKIDNVADHLYALGVREGTVVTIHLPNCPQAVMAIYAVAKLGGICNMVHALTPEKDIKENMVLTESVFLVTHLEVRDSALPERIKSIVVDLAAHMGLLYKYGYWIRYGRRFTGLPFDELETECGEKALISDPVKLSTKCLFYLHSSGTEGTPKIVMHSHLSINSWEADADEYYKNWNQTGRRIYCVLPYFHGFGLVTGLHHGMVNKMEQIIVSKFSAKETVKLLHKTRANVIIGTPALYEKLMREPGFTSEYLPYLNECTVGGDRADESLFGDYDRRLDPTGERKFLFEGYGLTEVISAASYNNAHFSYRRGSAGKLLPGIDARVRNDGNISRSGDGELLLSGNTMMMGYYKSQEQPFIEYEGKKWLPTGDLGRVDEEGFIYCTGRLKDIIIHNGYNVFPGRIESVISRTELVEESCVTGENEGCSSTQCVVAWIVPKTGVSRQDVLSAIKTICEEELLPFERPGQVRFIPELPRNDMRKVDKSALRKCKWETV